MYRLNGFLEYLFVKLPIDIERSTYYYKHRMQFDFNREGVIEVNFSFGLMSLGFSWLPWFVSHSCGGRIKDICLCA